MELYENEVRTARALRVRYLKSMAARGWKSLIGLVRRISQVPKLESNDIGRGISAAAGGDLDPKN